MKNDYYLYEHYHNGKIYYVGYGSLTTTDGKYIGFDRAIVNHKKGQKHYQDFLLENNIIWKRKEVVNNNQCKITHMGLTYQEAYTLEMGMIKEYGRIGYDKNGVLINKTEGGPIGRGCTPTSEHRQKISDAKKGKSYNLTAEEKLRRSEQSKLNAILKKENEDKSRNTLNLIDIDLYKYLMINLNKDMKKILKGIKYINIRIKRIEDKRNKPIISKEEHRQRTIEGMKRWKERIGEDGLNNHYEKLSEKNSNPTNEVRKRISEGTKNGMEKAGYNVTE